MTRLSWTLAVAILTQSFVLGATPSKRSYDTHNYYALEHHPRVPLDVVARTLEVEVVEQVGELANHWVVRTEAGLAARDEGFDPVIEKFRILRDTANSRLSPRSEDGELSRTVVPSVRYLARQTLRQRVKRAPPPIRPPSPASIQGVAQRFGIHDPLFPKQWHLVNEDYPQHVMNVVPVWEMGFTGKGVISAIVDDGLDYTSSDLSPNFSPENSYDFNDHEPLPYPKKTSDHHGTRCAGQIAAAKNNACGVGIAYDSKVAGIRILSKPISDVDEAVALNYGFQNISVYSCSWGPPDNGKAMASPSYLIKKAVLNGINNGRGGKGSIFVFASGNGGGHDDQCNFDGYTNSIYSVTVSALDYTGQHPYYSEVCAANMIAAYSSGNGRYIVTTDKGKDECTASHGGTSAAAPNVAGVFVLAVQARPELTWRDIQYLCIETAGMINPRDPDWERTATGRPYSYKYGYGVIDAHRYIKAAQTWSLVKPQAWFGSETVRLEEGAMDDARNYTGGKFIGPGGVTSTISITTKMKNDNNFENLEHLNIQVWISHTRRGSVEVELVSPNGIKSILGKTRRADGSKDGYPGWVFMSIKHWGEDPVGDWTIKVTDQNMPAQHNGSFLGWNLKFWGTTIDPSKAKHYELPLTDDILPPLDDPARPIIITPTPDSDTPTTNPPFPPGNSGSSTPSTSGTGHDGSGQGWVTDVSNAVTTHKTFVSSVGGGTLVLFCIGVCVFFWKRQTIRTKLSSYTTLPVGDDVAMGVLAGGRPTATGGPHRAGELYTPDREDGVSPGGRHPQDRVSVGLGFHSGFLDDDDLSTAGPGPTPKYRDEPDGKPTAEGVSGADGQAASPSVSGDGSWEHTAAP